MNKQINKWFLRFPSHRADKIAMMSSAIGKPAHSINVVILDDQHEVMFESIKRLEEAMKQGEGASEVPQVLDDLFKLVRFHFPTEQHLGMPGRS